MNVNTEQDLKRIADALEDLVRIHARESIYRSALRWGHVFDPKSYGKDEAFYRAILDRLEGK